MESYPIIRKISHKLEMKRHNSAMSTACDHLWKSIKDWQNLPDIILGDIVMILGMIEVIEVIGVIEVKNKIDVVEEEIEDLEEIAEVSVAAEREVSKSRGPNEETSR